jgi:hypothetical protein
LVVSVVVAVESVFLAELSIEDLDESVAVFAESAEPVLAAESPLLLQAVMAPAMTSTPNNFFANDFIGNSFLRFLMGVKLITFSGRKAVAGPP